MVRISIRSDVLSPGFLGFAFISFTHRLELHFQDNLYIFPTECLVFECSQKKRSPPRSTPYNWSPAINPHAIYSVFFSLRHNDLQGVIAQAEEARKRDPYDEGALYQEMLAEHKLNRPDRSVALVKEFQNAKTHNQEARTKYILQEPRRPSRSHSESGTSQFTLVNP
jgi:hypothetical protein